MKKSQKIHIFNRQKRFSIPKSDLIKRQVLTLMDQTKVDGDQLDIIFVSETEIKKIHEMLFQDDSLTDCITLPMDQPSDRSSGFCHLGEIYICPSVAHQEAKKRKFLFHEELTLYLVHAFLHILGYQDSPPSEKKRMRKKEKFLMTLLKQKQLL